MFDNADEDKDLESQVSKGSKTSTESTEPKSESKPLPNAAAGEEKKQDESAPEESKKD